MSLENVFGPNGLTYSPVSGEEVRFFKFPDGIVRAFRHLAAEWALYDLYLAHRKPGLHEALLMDVYDLSMRIRADGDHLSLEQRIQLTARQAFIDLPLRKMLRQGVPSNDSRIERNLRKVI